MTQAIGYFEQKEIDALEGKRPDTDRLTPGTYWLKIVKVVYGKKDAPPFKTKTTGDPMIGVVFASDTGAECFQMYALSDAALWKIMIVLHGAGIHGKDLDARGITLTSLAEPAVADHLLIGLQLRAEVKEQNGGGTDKDGNPYMDLFPLEPEGQPEPSTSTALPPVPPIDPDDPDIPF